MWYANKVRKNPELSTVREEDLLYNSHLKLQETPVITLRHKLVLVLFVATIGAVVLGVLKFDFYINEMAGLFLVCGILAGIIGGLSSGEIADAFLAGCSNMLFANLVIGMCNAAVLIMQNAHIMDTVIHYMASLLNGLPPTLSACGMFIVQDLFNVLVPSGSGKAAITMPLFAPLADLIGVTRQTAVLAFQMGDAFTNMITPASGSHQWGSGGRLCHGPHLLREMVPLAGASLCHLVRGGHGVHGDRRPDPLWSVLTRRQYDGKRKFRQPGRTAPASGVPALCPNLPDPSPFL